MSADGERKREPSIVCTNSINANPTRASKNWIAEETADSTLLRISDDKPSNVTFPAFCFCGVPLPGIHDHDGGRVYLPESHLGEEVGLRAARSLVVCRVFRSEPWSIPSLILFIW